MSKKLLIPLVKPSDAETVRAAGCEVLAEYPNSLLALATDKQQKSLESAGIETPELTDQAIQVSGARFAFATAVEANKSAPIPTDLQRTTYYIVKLIGPIKGEWLTAIKAAGAQI